MFKIREIIKLGFLGIFAVSMAGCASNSSESSWSEGLSNYVPGFIKPYRQDIQQGNIVTQEEADRLRIGMSKDQVRFILGTPLLNDPFHSDRWDYLFFLDKANGEVTRSRYTVIFDNGALTRHGGENVPDSTGELRQKDKRERRKIEPTTPESNAEERVEGTEKAPVLK